MNFTQIAINKNRVTYLLLLLIITLGIFSYNDLPRDSMPPYTIRTATVVTNFPGAAPERVELLISDKIEKIAQEIPEVDYIKSESRTGLSIVTVTLKENTKAEKLQSIWDKLRRKVDNIRSSLPQGIYGPNVKDDDIGVVYGISVALQNDGFEYTELEDYIEELRDDFIKLYNASRVEIGGDVEKPVYINFDDAKLSRFGLSSSKLKSIISSTNIIIPSGDVNFEGKRVILESSGSFETVDDIRQMLIPIGKRGETMPLGDITEVYRSYESPRKSIVKINGKEALILYISLKDGANIVDLGVSVDQVIEDYNKVLPVGISAVRVCSQDYDVQKSVDDFIVNVIQSVIIVLLVMLVFLGIRTGFVVASLIPFAIILTILLMNQFGIGLNQVSLAALIMALGMLVDNAIVMAESMIVKMENGATGFNAAIESSKELMIPLLISSLTTSAAFLSFFLAQSVMGEIMGQLFSVITISLLSSWIMALTIIPLLAVAFIRIKKNKVSKPTIFDKLNVYYNKLLTYSLKNPAIIIVSIVLTLFLSIFGFRFISFVFMPDSERNLVMLDLNLPLGTDISTTESNVADISKFINDSLLVNDNRKDGILDWSSFIGKGPKSYDLSYNPKESNSSYAHMLINTSHADFNLSIIKRLEVFCFNKLPDAEVTIKRLGSGGGSKVPIQVRVLGDDPNELYKISEQIKGELNSMKYTKNVSDNWGPKIKKFYIKINQAKLKRSGLTNQDIALSLNTVLSGYKVGEYREDDNSIPIVMRSDLNSKISYHDIESLNIYAQNSGSSVSLSQVANIIPDWQFAKILRRDLTKTITIDCYLKDGYTAGDVMKKLDPFLVDVSSKWNNGYRYEFGGDSEGSSKAMGAVADNLPLSLFIILLLLVMQFNSVRKTFIVISTIPFGIIGVVFGLLLTNVNMSFTGFLGIISLSGIIINNAIVLIDKIESESILNNSFTVDSIISAANERFRPILLTTFTTSLGMIPLWLSGGAMWQPLAVGIIFGLLFATFITLVFVPIVYKLLYKY